MRAAPPLGPLIECLLHAGHCSEYMGRTTSRHQASEGESERVLSGDTLCPLGSSAQPLCPWGHTGGRGSLLTEETNEEMHKRTNEEIHDGEGMAVRRKRGDGGKRNVGVHWRGTGRGAEGNRLHHQLCESSTWQRGGRRKQIAIR